MINLFEMNLLIYVIYVVFTAIVGVVMLIIGVAFVAGNGYYVFQIFDGYSVSLPLLLVAFFQCIAVAWVYGNDRYVKAYDTRQN